MRHAVRHGDIVVAWVDEVGNIAAVFVEKDIEHIVGEEVWDRVAYYSAEAAAFAVVGAVVVDQENIDNSWLQG